MKAAVAIQKRRHGELSWLAWHTAVLTRVEKIPSYREFSGERRARASRPWEAMEAELGAWAKASNENRGK